MLKRAEREPHVSGQLVDYYSKDASNALNGLLISEGICGMLDANNVGHINYVFPFVAAFIDGVCGEKNAMTTAISVLYIDVANCVMERPLKNLWTDEAVSKLQNVICDIQELVICHFDKHQPSSFRTEKLNVLCDFGDNIRRLRNMKMLEVGLY